MTVSHKIWDVRRTRHELWRLHGALRHTSPGPLPPGLPPGLRRRRPEALARSRPKKDVKSCFNLGGKVLALRVQNTLTSTEHAHEYRTRSRVQNTLMNTEQGHEYRTSSRVEYYYYDYYDGFTQDVGCAKNTSRAPAPPRGPPPHLPRAAPAGPSARPPAPEARGFGKIAS